MIVSDRKIQANRKNSIKGGKATSKKFRELYEKNAKTCPHCKTVLPYEKRKNKFCSQSCAASYNNKGVRRHGNPPGVCEVCKKPKASAGAKYCSSKCSAIARTVRTTEEKRASNAAAQAAYRAKYGYLRGYDSTADKEKIKEIYANCPEGHEVDHIIPLSKGGKHHEDNLQYLTIAENRAKSNKMPL